MTMNYLHYALIDKYQIQGDPVHMVRTFTFTSIAYRNLYARPGLIHTITFRNLGIKLFNSKVQCKQ